MQEESSTVSTTTHSAESNGLSSTRALSRKNRVFIFRDFLIETYSDYLLTPNEGDSTTTILDVAGGKGDLSWLLCNVDGLNSVVADPRITKQIHLLRSVEYLRQHPEQVVIRSVPGLPTFQPLATLVPKLENVECFVKPRHFRLLIDQDLVSAVRVYLETKSMPDWEQYWSRALIKAAKCQTLGYEESSSSLSVNQIADAMEALDTILKTRLVVGFHPDQATGTRLDIFSSRC